MPVQGKIIALQQHDGTLFSLYTNSSSHYHCLRSDLSEPCAVELAKRLNALLAIEPEVLLQLVEPKT